MGESVRKILIVLLSVLALQPAHAVSLISDTETEKLLHKMIAPVATAAKIPANRLKIHIVNNSDFNAFVMGGEEVFIYTGLLMKIRDVNALQAVVAHELGHTVGGHIEQMSSRMEAEMKRAVMIQALGIGLMVAGGNPSLGAGVLAGSGGVAKQSMLSFSRDEERIADDFAVDLMVQANINPSGLITVFNQMNDMMGATESKISKHNTNHPLTTERLKNTREKLKTIKHSGDYTVYSDAEYELVRAKLIGYLYPEGRVLDKYPYRDTSNPALYARAIGNMRRGALDAARMGARTLIGREPQHPYFYELLGDIEYQFGHYDDSIVAYESALKYDNDAPQIQTALALVLSERKKPDDNARAIELCKTSLLREPAPLTYWVLGKLYNDGREYWAMAEFYSMNGNSKKAKQFAQKAQDALKPDTPEYIKAGDILSGSGH